MISEFLYTFFKELNNNNIRYCILKNHDKLSQENGNDLDIWVDGEHSTKLKKILFTCCARLNYSVIRPNVSPRIGGNAEGKYYVVSNNSPFKVLHIDIWTYLYWRGIPIIDINKISKYIKYDGKGYKFLSSNISIYISLLNDILHKKKIRAKNKIKIKEISPYDFEDVKPLIIEFFGTKIYFLLKKALYSGNWGEVERKANYFRLALIKHALFKNIFLQLKYWFSYFGKGIKNYFLSQYGIFVVFIGPDGVGKTTISNMLLESEMVKKLFYRKYYFHTNFPILPRLRKIMRHFIFFKTQKKENEYKKDTKPLPWWRAIIYPIYYGFNYFLGHFWTWMQKTSGGSIIIFDRYFYEYFINPQFIKCPRWLLFLIEKFIVKPDLLIFLKTSPEIIYERKKELPIHEIERQLKECEKICIRYKNGFIIDASKPPEKILEEIQRKIINKLKIK